MWGKELKALGFRLKPHYLALAARICAKTHRVVRLPGSLTPTLRFRRSPSWTSRPSCVASARLCPLRLSFGSSGVCAYHARALREVYKSNGGWTEGEVSHLQTVFNRYDVKRNGRIASKESGSWLSL